MKKIRNIVLYVLSIVSIFALGFFSGHYYFELQQSKQAQVAKYADEEKFDLKLPGEVEKRVVTADEVEAKLVEIGQLATYSEEYIRSKSIDQSRYLLEDIRIPGTTNTISIECRGVVKVGYDVNDIVPTVDNDSCKIYIALPEAAVLDNYVIWDSIKDNESNNILNPIEFDQYQDLISEIEQDGLRQAEEDGIYEAAEENVKTLIQNFLAGFEDYEIVFM